MLKFIMALSFVGGAQAAEKLPISEKIKHEVDQKAGPAFNSFSEVVAAKKNHITESGTFSDGKGKKDILVEYTVKLHSDLEGHIYVGSGPNRQDFKIVRAQGDGDVLFGCVNASKKTNCIAISRRNKPSDKRCSGSAGTPLSFAPSLQGFSGLQTYYCSTLPKLTLE